MKYVYAIMTVLGGQPMMQTLLNPTRMTGREVLDRVILTPEERTHYKSWQDENEILKDMNQTQQIRVEIQEVEVP